VPKELDFRDDRVLVEMKGILWNARLQATTALIG